MTREEAVEVVAAMTRRAVRFEVTDAGQLPEHVLVGLVIEGTFQTDGSHEFFEALRVLCAVSPAG